MNRDDIHIIARHSNWAESSVSKALKENVYSDSRAWRKFLQLLFISLGVGFTVSGIIFFFAYNWADLHKFAKIGMVESLIVIFTSFVLLSKLSEGIKNVILTGGAVLVGVLFAVFGQIYQTGANAYDFFLGWTVFITLWAIISNYPPLWLVYLVIVYTTFVLYSRQVAQNWSEMFVITILFLTNTLVLVVFLYLSALNRKLKVSLWFTNVLVLVSVFIATIGIITVIFDRYEAAFAVLPILVLIAYVAGIMYGLKMRSGFYLSIIPFSIIVIISAFLIKVSDGAGMFFTVGIFIIVSITLLIKNLITLQKKWNNAN